MNKPIMTVKEARKLLGKKYATISDTKIEKLINDTHELAKIALRLAKEKRVASTKGAIDK